MEKRFHVRRLREARKTGQWKFAVIHFCGARLCPEDQPQRVDAQNRLVLSGRAAAGRGDTAALRAK